MSGIPLTPNTSRDPDASALIPYQEDIKPDITEIDAQRAIQTKLNRRLGPEYVSTRPAPGGGPKLTYVEGWKIIGLANEVFGYDGWSSSVLNVETDFCDMDPETKRFNVGVSALVKITLRNGSFHEDVGYGAAENLKSKGAALDKAKKEAVTDAVKRALRNFGSLLGLCLYEKVYAQEVSKIKVPPPKFDHSDLHHGPNTPSPAQKPYQDPKPISSVPPHMRAGTSSTNNRAATPQTPVSPTVDAQTNARAQSPLAYRSGPGVNQNQQRPPQQPPRNAPAGPTKPAPAPTHASRPPQPAPAPVPAAGPSGPPNLVPASAPSAVHVQRTSVIPQPASNRAPASEKKVTFAPQNQEQRANTPVAVRPAPAEASRTLQPTKSEDYDEYWSKSDDDAMNACFDLIEMGELDENFQPIQKKDTPHPAPAPVPVSEAAQAPRGNFKPAGVSRRNANGAPQPVVGGSEGSGGYSLASGGNRAGQTTPSNGLKRSADTMQSGSSSGGARRSVPQQGMGLTQRQPLGNLDLGASGDVKRVRR